MKSGNLNFLEPSGPLQACNGTALTYSRRPFVWVEIFHALSQDETTEDVLVTRVTVILFVACNMKYSFLLGINKLRPAKNAVWTAQSWFGKKTLNTVHPSIRLNVP